MANEFLNVVATADIKDLQKGMADARTSLAQTAMAATKLDSTLKTSAVGASQAGQALTNVGRVAQDLPFGFMGIQNNLNPLLESFQRLKTETGSNVGALKALGSSLIGPGGIGLALSVVSSAIVIFQNGISGFNKKAKEAKEASEDLAKATKAIFADAAKEETQVLSLIGVLNNETESRNRKLSAIKELQNINPEVFKGIQLEGNLVTGLDAAYIKYIETLKTVIAVKIKQQQLEKITQQILEYEGGTLTKSLKEGIEKLKEYNKEKEKGNGIGLESSKVSTVGQQRVIDGEIKINQLKKDQLDIAKDISELSAGVKLKDIKITESKVKPEKAVKDYLLEALRKDAELELKNPIKIAPVVLQTPVIKNKGWMKDILDKNAEERQAIKDWGNRITETMQSVAVDAFSTLGESIGNAMSGGKNIFGGLFSGIFKSIGAGLKQLGAYAITTSKLILALKATIGSTLGIAGGIALIALGTLISNAAGKIKGPAFATGVRNFGGGTALVGERGPELVQLPKGSNVVPNGNLNAMGGGNAYIMETVIRGQDLAVILKRANQTISRNG